MRTPPAPPACTVRPTPWCVYEGRSPRFRRPLHVTRAILPIAKRAVLADEQIEVRPLLVGELEEHLLALGILEALAVALEELVRAALASDPDEQRPRIVDALAELLGASREEAARRALEEEKRRPCLELRIAGRQL